MPQSGTCITVCNASKSLPISRGRWCVIGKISKANFPILDNRNTLYSNHKITMYNVRYFEYENTLQFRVYSEPVRCKDSIEVLESDVHVVNVNGDFVCVNSGEVICEDFGYDEFEDDDFYMPAPDGFNFDLLEIAMQEELKRKHEDSIRSSVGRTKRNIVYLTRSNNWDWFVTFTLSPDKVNRYDYSECTKKVRKFLNNLRRSVPDMVYIMVPELHKDGAWHFHGLMNNVDSLKFTDSGIKDDHGDIVYNMDKYNLGWSYCSKVRESDKAANYIMKYITKDLCEESKNRQRYWPSKNIKRAKVYEAMLSGDDLKKLMSKLYDKMTWKKLVQSEYYDVNLFEVPKDFFGKEC